MRVSKLTSRRTRSWNVHEGSLQNMISEYVRDTFCLRCCTKGAFTKELILKHVRYRIFKEVGISGNTMMKL